MNLAELGHISTIVLAGIAVLAAIVSLVIWYANVNSDRKRQQADTEKLQADAESRNQLAEKLKADNKNFKAFMAEVRGKLEDIAQKVNQLWGASEAASAKIVADTQSPLRLNDLGRGISDAFGAKAWASAHADDVRGKAAGKSAYDIQQFCFDYVTENLLTKDEVDTL